MTGVTGVTSNVEFLARMMLKLNKACEKETPVNNGGVMIGMINRPIEGDDLERLSRLAQEPILNQIILADKENKA